MTEAQAKAVRATLDDLSFVTEWDEIYEGYEIVEYVIHINGDRNVTPVYQIEDMLVYFTDGEFEMPE